MLETTPLGPNRNLHLVRVGERVLVVGATDHGITALDAFDRDAAIDEGLLAEPTPDELLAEALGPDTGDERPPRPHRRAPRPHFSLTSRREML